MLRQAVLAKLLARLVVALADFEQLVFFGSFDDKWRDRYWSKTAGQQPVCIYRESGVMYFFVCGSSDTMVQLHVIKISSFFTS